MRHTIKAGHLTLEKTESFETDGSVVFIDFQLENTSSSTLSDVTVLWVTDPDQNWYLSDIPDDGDTTNDSLDLDGDGIKDFAQSVGADTGYTFGVGLCDGAREEVGHARPNTDRSDYSYSLSDSNGVSSDLIFN